MQIKRELISVRIPEALNKKLTDHVEPLGISKNAFILGLIHKELSKGTNNERADTAPQATAV